VVEGAEPLRARARPAIDDRRGRGGERAGSSPNRLGGNISRRFGAFGREGREGVAQRAAAVGPLIEKGAVGEAFLEDDVDERGEEPRVGAGANGKVLELAGG